MSRHSFTIAPKTLRVALATIAAATGMAATSGVAAASDHAQDEITFSALAYLAPQSDGTTNAVVISKSCTLTSDGGEPLPCRLEAMGKLQADGTGDAHAVVSAPGRVLHLDYGFSTTPSGGGIGIGTVQEVGPGGPQAGTFTAEFGLSPTDKPNVFDDWGTIHVTH